MMDFFSQLKRARLFGHPIHSMLVHFPSALFPISLAFDLLALWFNSSCLACSGFFSIAAGLIMGFIAACVGAVDYIHLPTEHPGWNKASLHALLNIMWLIFFGVVLGMRLNTYTLVPTMPEIALSAVGVLGLIISNYLGGDLVFRHKIGFDAIDNNHSL